MSLHSVYDSQFKTKEGMKPQEHTFSKGHHIGLMLPTSTFIPPGSFSCEARLVVVRGRSASSDVSSDISPSPLYIPPHCH